MNHKRIILAIALLLMVIGLRAQTLVVDHVDGTTTEVKLTTVNYLSVADGYYVVVANGTETKFSVSDVKSISYQWTNGDVNRDGDVGIGDIVAVTNIMAGIDNDAPDYGQAPEGAKAIDLGLPSGTMWANMNVGAESPQEAGLYFAWGETEGYNGDASDGHSFNWTNYKWMTEGQASWKYINKYQLDDHQTDACWYVYDWDIVDYKFVGDGKSVLAPEDDAAHVNWGGDWCMPTNEDIQELLANTTTEWTTALGMVGCKFTSKTNGNSIFLPAVGYRSGTKLYGHLTYGRCWSSSVNPLDSSEALNLYFDSELVTTEKTSSRNVGRSVRPVLKN